MKNLNSLFIPYKLAVIAKQKGFNEPCFAWFYFKDKEIEFEQIKNSDLSDNKNCSLPLYQQIVDWFRKKQILILQEGETYGSYPVFKVYKYKKHISVQIKNFSNNYIGYRAAFNKAIEEAFKLI